MKKFDTDAMQRTSEKFNNLSRIAIVGAGAVGGYYGARLARAGADVRFLMEEIVAAARRFGHEIPVSFIDEQFERTAWMGPYRPSSLIDRQEGREVEVEPIWGEPLRRAWRPSMTGSSR